MKLCFVQPEASVRSHKDETSVLTWIIGCAGMRTGAQLTLAGLVLIAALNRRQCEAAELGGHCPISLDWCACMVVRRGPRVLCNATADGDAVSDDLSRLAGFAMDSLILDGVNLTTLPRHYFVNLTVKALVVRNTPMQSTEEDSFEGLTHLTTLDMSHNRLRAIPRGLTAVPTLKILRLPENYIADFKNLPPLENLTDLDLSKNLIEKLDGNVLKDFPKLKRVWLANNLIIFLSTSFFKGAKNVTFVDLHNNMLTNVHTAFQGLRHLTELDLSRNSITDIDKLSTGTTYTLRILRASYNSISWLSRIGPFNILLETIELTHCNISELRRETFSQLPELLRLDLSYNAIQYIPGNCFHKESKLKYFSAAGNKLFSITNTFSVTRRMEVLNLSMNFIEDLEDSLFNMPALKELTLRNNRIKFIRDGTFRSNSYIKHLDLSGNDLNWVGIDSFERLFSLEVLLMTGTSVMSLNGSLHELPKLRHLFIHDNRLKKLRAADFKNSPQIVSIDAKRNNITDVQGAFRKLDNLKSLSLRRNRLKSIHRASFPNKLDRLKTLVLDENPLFCDCQLSWLIETAPSLLWKGVPVCHGPDWNRGKQLYSLSADNLTEWFANCSQSCNCVCHKNTSFSAAILVNCSRRGLQALPKEFPWKTYLLDLSWNRLRQLDNRLVHKTPSLDSLLMANNLLSDIGTGVIPRSTEKLDLTKNRLRRFPLGLVSERTVASVWLSGNPWKCSCEDYPFRQWAESHSYAIRDYNETLCEQGKKFIDLGEKDLCPSRKVFIILAYGVPSLVLMVTAMAAVTAYLKYKHEIRVWLYARGICRSLKCIKEDDVDEDKDFDVFLSFSSKDREWAYSELLPKVEANGFSVCTYDRNFKGGFLIQDIVQEAVCCSRRTLLVVTQNYVESEWCRWEFRVAQHRALEDNINRLIVVVVGDVRPEGVDEELQRYMQETNYLRWGEAHFWDKLLYSLPKRDARTRVIPNMHPLTRMATPAI
ncbi:toll-like receptor 2 type-2 [Amblyomma americanum]